MDGSTFLAFLFLLWLIAKACHGAFKAVNKDGAVMDATKNGLSSSAEQVT